MILIRSGVTEYYSYSDIKSVSPYKNVNGEFIIIFNFINESRDSTLRVPLALIDNQPTWTDINLALADIKDWMGACNSTNTAPQQRKAYVERVSTPWTSTEDIFSFSVANVGTGNGTVQGATIKPGEIVNFDASSLNNFFPISAVVADGTDTELLITWIGQG